jgi:hypothetical protein
MTEGPTPTGLFHGNSQLLLKWGATASRHPLLLIAYNFQSPVRFNAIHGNQLNNYRPVSPKITGNHATPASIYPSHPTTSNTEPLNSPSAHGTTELEASMTNPVPNPQPLTPECRNRANRANAKLSSSPRTAVIHGFTSRSPVLATEDAAQYQRHCRQFLPEYKPATGTETQLTQELADTAWRLNRIPHLETALLDRAANPPSEQARIDFDIVDAHRAVAILGQHYTRLSRQFQKALDHLHEIQSERTERERHDLKEAAALLEFHKRTGLPGSPSIMMETTPPPAGSASAV